jgi:hypothetical protein
MRDGIFMRMVLAERWNSWSLPRREQETKTAAFELDSRASPCHPEREFNDPKDLGGGKLRPPRSFRLVKLALRMTAGPAGTSLTK